MKKETVMDRLMNEVIIPWNGMLYTRSRAIQMIDDHFTGYTPEQREWARYCFCFSKPALTDAEIEKLYNEGRLVNSVPNEIPQEYLEAVEAS